MAGRRLFSTRRHSRSPRIRLWGVIGVAFAIAVLVSFVSFVAGLPKGPPDPLPEADAIVALTGGAERLDVAMALLNEGRAKRLLITGVHAQTTREDLRRRIDDSANRFECCVDLDRAALNTVGNAIETKRWVRSHGYRSLIVVTAQYHMPRALRELRYVMPDVTLSGYPVFPVRVGGWWRNLGTLQLLVGEYAKTQMASLRMAVTDLLKPNG